MKNYIQVIFLILFFHVSCQKTVKEDVEKSNKLKKISSPLEIHKGNINKRTGKGFKKNTIREIFKTKDDSISQKWFGNYSIGFSRGRKYSTAMYWEHTFTITKGFCIYEGSGFQFYSKYNCDMKEKKDTLLIFAKENIDGYQVYEKDELIIKIYKVGDCYYTNTKDLKPEEAENKSNKYGFEVIKSK